MFNRQAYESFKLNPEVRPTISLTLLDVETDYRLNGSDRIFPFLDCNHTDWFVGVFWARGIDLYSLMIRMSCNALWISELANTVAQLSILILSYSLCPPFVWEVQVYS
jgi:hypothetical protein